MPCFRPVFSVEANQRAVRAERTSRPIATAIASGPRLASSRSHTWGVAMDVRGKRRLVRSGVLRRRRTPILASLSVITLLVPAAVILAGVPAGAAKPSGGLNPAGNLDQCQNGQVSPFTRSPCVNGTISSGDVTGTFSDWVNGNVNGSKAHWREGDFLTYRDTLTGLGNNTYTLNMHYDTVHGGKHAIDYLGSYDATEKSTLAETTLNANHNNPCVDKLGSTRCPLTAPPSASNVSGQLPGLPTTSSGGDPTNCGGSSGTFNDSSGELAAGRIVNVFAPSAATVSPVTVTQGHQTLSGTGQCSAPFSVTFTLGGTVPTGGYTVVVAIGGHIAAQTDWGIGNSASAISGSPYHMAQDSLKINGGAPVSIGAQDRALSTSAIFFTPAPITAIVDETSGTSTYSAGDSFHDTTSFTAGTFAVPMSGTVTYHFVTGATASDTSTGCATSITGGGTDSTLDTETVASDGTVPDSTTTEGPLGAGDYAFYAVYSGGGANIGGTSACEPFSLSRATPSFSTQQTVLPNDSATFSGLVNPDGTGTVTFYLWSGSTCGVVGTDTPVYTEAAQNVVSGTDTYSTNNTATTVSPGATTTYTWEVVWTGDGNNSGSDVCEDGTLTNPLQQEQLTITGS